MQLWAVRFAGVLAAALAVAACNTTGPSGGGFAAGQRTTVAFDRIDGPPPAVFERFVAKLSAAAEQHQVPVVSREGFAPYRIKGAMAVSVQRGQASLAWVWDVYDSESSRAVRLSGEEKIGRAGRDAWQAVNDEVLARIARTGMEQLAVYFRSPDAPAPTPGPAIAPGPASPGTAVADAGSRVNAGAAGSLALAGSVR
jgi:hypothetical protein